ncbi:MAG: hypothetical protein MJ003_04730 [Paludibacteraceae bacterium]|nr:hypothetical protein [Paludibacteraceae bacterium]
MDVYSKIKNSIKEMGGNLLPGLKIAKVVSCSGYTCTVQIDTIQLKDVRLRAVINNNEDKVLLTPKTGSYVLVYDMSDGKMRDLVVMSCSEVEKIEIKTENTTVDIDKNGVSINGGNLGGLVKISELTNKLNAIENDINSLKNAMQGWTPSPNDGGAALKGAVATWFANSLTVTQQNDIEDDKVKH